MQRVDARAQLVATGLGNGSPGGLFVLGDQRLETLDQLSSTGFAVTADRERAARLLWTDDDPQGCGELLIYDRRGVQRYHRVDELREPHSALWDGDHLIVVSTLDDSLLWLDAAGNVASRWTAHGGGDCWHLNCLVRHEGRLLVTAFGRFERHRGWSEAGARPGAGELLDVESGDTVIGGLDAPHDPTFVDGRWLICNSGAGEVVAIAPDGTVRERVQLEGWTRGLAFDDDELHVGVSARRHGVPGEATTARVVTLDRRTLRQLRTRDLPCEEVYALAWVEPALVEGLRAGFGTNTRRVRDALLSTPAASNAGRPLAGDELNASVELTELPARTEVGHWLSVVFTARNHGPARLRSSGSNAVLLGARWSPVNHPAHNAGEQRTRLPWPLLPGASALGRMYLQAPAEPGEYVLHASFLQEHVRWFSDADPMCGREYRILVTANK